MSSSPDLNNLSLFSWLAALIEQVDNLVFYKFSPVKLQNVEDQIKNMNI